MCSGGEETLLECPRGYRSGEMLVERELGDSDCSHEEDAGVRCDGESVSVKATAPTSNMHPAIIMLCEFSISFPDFKASGTGNWWFLVTANPHCHHDNLAI